MSKQPNADYTGLTDVTKLKEGQRTDKFWLLIVDRICTFALKCGLIWLGVAGTGLTESIVSLLV
jgi:hypothetical protein